MQPTLLDDAVLQPQKCRFYASSVSGAFPAFVACLTGFLTINYFFSLYSLLERLIICQGFSFVEM